MDTFAVVLDVILAVMVGASAAATAAGVQQIRDNLLGVGVPEDRLRLLAIPKALGAVGLLIGLAATGLAVAAAIGLVAYFVLAVAAHVRVKQTDAQHLAPPVLFLVVSVVTLFAIAVS